MGEFDERRKRKKRKEAAQALVQYQGLSFNPEIELKKWEIYEDQKLRMMERLEDDIEIFAEITEELELENLGKREEIEDLLTNLSHGSSMGEAYEADKAKIRLDVDAARSDLKWATEEQKRLE